MTREPATVIQPADAGDQRELWKRLADLRVMMLTTHDANDDAGTLTARPVAPLKVDSDGQIWFFTALDGGIANDIRRDPEVHVSFVDQGNDLFASLSGDAEVVRDPQKARELWSAIAGAWFPGGPDDANLAVGRIDVRRGDYWDVKDSKLVQFFKMATAAALKKRPEDLGTHRRFTQ